MESSAAQTGVNGGGVVILGVQGSGKTVFLSVLGETFSEGGVFGLSLSGDPATEDFTADMYRLMEWEHQFPESTDRTVAVPLSWKVNAGAQTLFTLTTLDCAGELIVDAFAPGAEKREAGEDADEENAFAEVSSGNASRKTAIDRLRELVRNAKVLCLFVNPNDFKRNQRQDGSRQQRDAAFRRYRDMDRLLEVFLRGNAAGTTRPIVIVLTQTGDEALKNEIAYHGGPSGYLFDAYRKLRKLPRAIDSHVICVSAVNEEVRTGSRKWVDDRGQTHVEPVMGPAPAFTSTGLVDFLLAVGGEVSPDLAPLGRAMREMRAAATRLANARFSGQGAKERRTAAQAIVEASGRYDDAAAAFLNLHAGARRFEDDMLATEKHRAAEKAAALHELAVETVVDAALRAAAFAGRDLDEEEDVVAFGREIAESAMAANDAGAQAVSADALFPVAGWLREQAGTYRSRQGEIRGRFVGALSSEDMGAARDAFSQAREWFPQDCRELESWPDKMATLERKLERKASFSSVDGILDEAGSAISGGGLGPARDAIAQAESRLGELERDIARWGDGGEIKRRRGWIAELVGQCASLEVELAARALAKRKEHFQREMQISMGQIRQKLAEWDLDWIRADVNRIKGLAGEASWPEAKRDAETFEGEVEELIANARVRRRKTRRIIAATVIILIASAWIWMRIEAVGRINGVVSLARIAAMHGQYDKASNMLAAIKDVPGLLVYKERMIDEELATAIGIGCGDKGRLETTKGRADSALRELESRFKSALASDTPELAPQQWKVADEAYGKAVGAKPSPKIGTYGLPESVDAYKEAISAYQSVPDLCSVASIRLDAALNAAEEVRREKRRKEEVKELGNTLREMLRTQDWTAVARTVPENMNDWLDLPDADLAGKKDELAHGIKVPAGEADADAYRRKMTDTYTRFKEKANQEEMGAFKAEMVKLDNQDASAERVMSMYDAIKGEQARRLEFNRGLMSVSAAIGVDDYDDVAGRIDNLCARLMGEEKERDALRVDLADAVCAAAREAIRESRWEQADRAIARLEKLPPGKAANNKVNLVRRERVDKEKAEIKAREKAAREAAEAARLAEEKRKWEEFVSGVRTTLADVAIQASYDWRGAYGKLVAITNVPGELAIEAANATNAVAAAVTGRVDAAVAGSPEDDFAEAVKLGEPFAAKVGAALDKALKTRWPMARPGKEPDWDAMRRMREALEAPGSCQYGKAGYLVDAFKSWRGEWMKNAESWATEAAKRNSDTSWKVDHALKAEEAMAFILAGERAICGGRDGESYRSRVKACREKLPPLLRVSVYDTSYDGVRHYVDAAAKMVAPAGKYYSTERNGDTGCIDAIIAMDPGASSAISLDGDTFHNVFRDPVDYNWHGIRHVALALNKDEQESVETRVDRLLGAE